MNSQERLYTLSEISEISGIHRNTLRTFVYKGKLKAIETSKKRGTRFLIPEKALIESDILNQELIEKLQKNTVDKTVDKKEKAKFNEDEQKNLLIKIAEMEGENRVLREEYEKREKIFNEIIEQMKQCVKDKQKELDGFKNMVSKIHKSWLGRRILNKVYWE